MNYFWENFWPDFFSNLVVGVLLGVLGALWVGRKLNEMERKHEQIAVLHKNIRYLEMLKDEVSTLLEQLPGLVKLSRPYQEPQKIRIVTPFWDALQPSGELPKLIDPRLLASLTQFYDHLAYAQQGLNWLMDRLVNSTVVNQHTLKQEEIQEVIPTGLQDAQQAGMNLTGQIDSEIDCLRKQLADLES
jgi:hypothetical protein